MPEPIEAYTKNTRIKHFPKGQIILYVDDTFNEVYVLKSGVVKLYDIDDDGNEKILHIVKAPALIPYAFFSGNNSVTRWFYAAVNDCDVYVLDKAALQAAMEDDGKLAMHLVNNFSLDVHELLVRLSSMGKTKAYDKLTVALRFLVVWHALQRPSGWWRIQFPVNHQMLADMVGLTRESTAVVMKELQDKKIIRNPRLTILEVNKDRLYEAIEQSSQT